MSRNRDLFGLLEPLDFTSEKIACIALRLYFKEPHPIFDSGRVVCIVLHGFRLGATQKREWLRYSELFCLV
jgi:hypothetical protein